MAHTLWSQDVFTKGEISPLMYARVSVSPYYNGLKTATNVITFPQGAAGKRFGTFYRNLITGVTAANQIFFKSMQYLNECVYLIAIIPNAINIYLEGILVRQITGTIIGANLIPLIDYTILDNIFRITTGIAAPQDITRGADSPNTITSISTINNTITLTPSYYLDGMVLPVRFSTSAGGVLFSGTPQVLAQKTYFLYFISSTIAQIYMSATDAIAQINPFIISSSGTGTQFATLLNTWAINPTAFINLPVYDFGGINYSAITFTPSAVSGNSVTITTSVPIFLPGVYVGGGFEGNSGISRILSINTSSQITVTTLVPFASTAPILGLNAVLTEPAWSNARGWPRVCSSFQNRAFFGNTDLLPNGLWASVTNDFNNYNDLQNKDDSAISWYPTSDDINYIRFIVPYRSLTVHTNSGVYSTPLSVETAITPSNFSLTLQDSTPAEAVQPRGIDNQIIILSGNDAHSLLWDGFNNAYQSNIISIANEQLIRDPVDEAAFVDLTRAGSRYMLIVNDDGTLAIYQTLISEDVQGFTPAELDQTYGNAYFRWVTTSSNGRGWFVTERQLGTPTSSVNITGNSANTLTVTGSNLSTTSETAFYFTTSGALPQANPELELGIWYWAIAVDANTIKVYTNQDDAKAGINAITFSNFGSSSQIVPYPLATYFFIEELSFNSKVDCAFQYQGTPQNTFSGLFNFNAQFVKINGDGYGFEYTGFNSTVITSVHGMITNVSSAQIGFPINVEIEPLPLSVFGSSTKTTDLLSPKLIREVSMMFADTIGGYINFDVPIAITNFDEVQIGSPPLPTNGIIEFSPMAGWDDYKNIGFTITHNEPFDIKLIGLFYKVDV